MQVSLQAARTILSHGCCPTASLSVEWPGAVANSMPSKNGPCEFSRSPLVPFLAWCYPNPAFTSSRGCREFRRMPSPPLSSSCRSLGRSASASFFEVGRPFRVERMGLTDDLDMSSDRGVRGLQKSRSLPVLGSEDPLARTDFGEVFLPHPTCSLVRVTAFGPSPQHLPDVMIDPPKGLLGHDVPVRIGPSPDERIQRFDQLLLAYGFRFPDDVPNFRQKVLDVLL